MIKVIKVYSIAEIFKIVDIWAESPRSVKQRKKGHLNRKKLKLWVLPTSTYPSPPPPTLHLTLDRARSCPKLLSSKKAETFVFWLSNRTVVLRTILKHSVPVIRFYHLSLFWILSNSIDKRSPNDPN